MCHTLGVSTTQFSIQVWFLNGHMSLNNPQTPTQRGLVLEYPSTLPSDMAEAALRPLAFRCFSARDGFQQSIDNDPGDFGPRFDRNSAPFSRYVCAHILRPCLTDCVGLILVTAKQETAFADDAVDVLKFFAGAIATYTNMFIECCERIEKSRPNPRFHIVISGNEHESVEALFLDSNGCYSSHAHVLAPEHWRLKRKDGTVLLNISGPRPSGSYSIESHDGGQSSIVISGGQN